MKETIVFFTILYLSSSIYAARILGIFPVAAKSNFLWNHAIMNSLHRAGHNITMITPFPSDSKDENFTYIDSRFDTFVYVGQSKIEDFYSLTVKSLMEMATTKDIQNCYDIMKVKAIQPPAIVIELHKNEHSAAISWRLNSIQDEVLEALNSPIKLYDIMFVGILFAHNCYLPLAEKLNVPVIGTVSTHMSKLADISIGLPNNPAIINALGTKYVSSAGELSFVERVHSFWANLMTMFYYHTKVRRALDEFYRTYFTEDLLYRKDISLIFYNNHASLLPRPTTPNAIEIGGIHIEPVKKLPEDILVFIDGATHGVILFSFGSLVRTSTLEHAKKHAFLTAFAAIPQRVIWKYEESIENLPKNVMLSSWLPQRDILEHENVIAFISHCGQSGTYEAIVTGTPVISIPLFGDQFQNAAHLVRRGVAVNLDHETVTKNTISIALDAIINDTSYFRNMQTLSHAFKDRPTSPQESVVYWTEYVIRHNGGSHLEVLGMEMPLFKYLMLDIILFFFISTTAIIFISFLIVKKIFGRTMKREGNKLLNQKNKT